MRGKIFSADAIVDLNGSFYLVREESGFDYLHDAHELLVGYELLFFFIYRAAYVAVKIVNVGCGRGDRIFIY